VIGKKEPQRWEEFSDELDAHFPKGDPPTTRELRVALNLGGYAEWEAYESITPAVEIVHAMREAEQGGPVRPAKKDAKPARQMVPPKSEEAGVPAEDLALSYLLADEAGQTSAVREFRNKVLGGHVLSPMEVWPWLDSRSQLDLSEGQLNFRGRGRVRTANQPMEEGMEDEGWRKVVEGRIAMPRPTDWLWVYSGPARGSLPARMMVIPRRGVLQRLKRVSERLAPIFGWDAAQALTFVLTGVPPLVEGVEVEMPRQGHAKFPLRIRLSVAAGTPPERVAAAYRRHRDYVAPKGDRALSERQFRLLVFALQNPEIKGMRLWVEWNNQHPSWAYAHYSSFSRAITDTRRRVLDLHRVGVDPAPAASSYTTKNEE